MKLPLRPFSMFMKVGVSLLIFNLIPYTQLNSCGGGYYEDYESFSVFLDDKSDWGSLSKFTNEIWSRSEKGLIDSLEHPNNYDINVAEWQYEIGNKAKDDDIFKILYKTDPDDYFKNEATLKTQNSFVKAISDDKELLPYLQFAKKCENLMANVQWDYDQTKDTYVSNANRPQMQKLAVEGVKLAETFTNQFTKYRAAYLTLKLYNYLGKKETIKDFFMKYFKNPVSESWIFGSAKYYYALAHTNKLERMVLFAQTFDNSADKRITALRRLDYLDYDSLDYTLPLVPKKNDKAALLVMKSLYSNSSPQMETIKKIYDLNPQNQDLALLIHQEAVKLEDWLVPPIVKEENLYIRDNDRYMGYYKETDNSRNLTDMDDNLDSYYSEDSITEAEYKKRRTDLDKKWIEKSKINRQNDLRYCAEILGFIEKVISEKKQTPYEALHLTAAAHICFLKQDWTKLSAFNEQIEKSQKASKSLKEQAKLLTFLALITQSQKLTTPSVETALVNYFDYLKNDKSSLPCSKYIKRQVAHYCASEFIKKGQLAKGILFLSKSNSQLYTSEGGHNIYHKLLELAEPKDYDDLLTLINKKGKSRFETFLTSEPVPYKGWDESDWVSEKDSSMKEMKWSTSKIKEYKSMYYLRHNNLEGAYNAIKDVPNSYWDLPAFRYYASGNIFRTPVAMPNQIEEEKKPDLNNRQILEKMVLLKKQLDSDPIKYADNNMLLGNAYYGMSYKGQSWLMWDIRWSEWANPRLSAPLSIAEKYYIEGMKKSKNVEVAAVCYYMASVCKYNWKRLEAKENAYTSVFKSRFPKEQKYTTLKYWCTEQ